MVDQEILQARATAFDEAPRSEKREAIHPRIGGERVFEGERTMSIHDSDIEIEVLPREVLGDSFTDRGVK